MARRLVRLFLLLAGFVLVVSGTVHAQSAISGAVRDTSGAVMPGVSVEVASPVLIEKVRVAVTDEQGRFTIIDLRPGTYTVTFSLEGFNTYRQEGLELPANFTATVNADLRVGSSVRGVSDAKAFEPAFAFCDGLITGDARDVERGFDDVL